MKKFAERKEKRPLDEKIREQVRSRMQGLDWNQSMLAADLRLSVNTISNAMSGKSVHRNTVLRLTDFARAQPRRTLYSIELTDAAMHQIERMARGSGAAPSEWCNAFAAWMEQKDDLFRSYISDSVAMFIRSIRMAGISEDQKADDPVRPRAGSQNA